MANKLLGWNWYCEIGTMVVRLLYTKSPILKYFPLIFIATSNLSESTPYVTFCTLRDYKLISDASILDVILRERFSQTDYKWSLCD